MIIRNEENRPFLYYTEFAKHLLHLNAGVMLSWAYEWARMGSRHNRINIEGEEYCQITASDLHKKTGLTPGEQAEAGKILREAGLLIEHVTRSHLVLVFRVDMDAANQILSQETDTEK